MMTNATNPRRVATGEVQQRRVPAPGPNIRELAVRLATAGAWDDRYRSGSAAWHTSRPSAELVRTVVEDRIAPCAAVDLGCGLGHHAIWLAQQGFDVTGVDLSPFVVERARARAAEAGAAVRFVAADLLDPGDLGGPYDFLFDRGCYHFVRLLDLDRYLRTLRQLTRPGSVGLFLTGNANEPPSGPPILTEAEVRGELATVFDIVRLREFRFESDTDARGFLGWSCLARRA